MWKKMENTNSPQQQLNCQFSLLLSLIQPRKKRAESLVHKNRERFSSIQFSPHVRCSSFSPSLVRNETETRSAFGAFDSYSPLMIREWSREKPKRASTFSHSIDNTQHCTIATRVTLLKKAPIVVNSRTILVDRRSESFSFTFAVNLITSKSLGKIYIKAAVCRFVWLVNNLISNKVQSFGLSFYRVCDMTWFVWYIYIYIYLHAHTKLQIEGIFIYCSSFCESRELVNLIIIVQKSDDLKWESDLVTIYVSFEFFILRITRSIKLLCFSVVIHFGQQVGKSIFVID